MNYKLRVGGFEYNLTASQVINELAIVRLGKKIYTHQPQIGDLVILTCKRCNIFPDEPDRIVSICDDIHELSPIQAIEELT